MLAPSSGHGGPSWATWGRLGPILSRNGAPSWSLDGPKIGPRGPKKGPQELERRLGSELDLIEY